MAVMIQPAASADMPMFLKTCFGYPMNTREIEAEVQRIERAIKERQREIAELKIMLRDLWTERNVNRLLYQGHRSRSARAA